MVVWGLFCGVLGARCWVVRERPCGGFLVCGRVAAGLVGLVVVRLCLFVENFIVDASIFVVVIVLCAPAGWAGWPDGFGWLGLVGVCCVASYLVRSVDALAPRADEGRCNLR